MAETYKFRRCTIGDAELPFKTGFRPFDLKNEATGTLKEYIAEDSMSHGEFFTYLLFEERNEKESDLMGLTRFKFIEDKKAFLGELKDFGVPFEYRYEIAKDIKDLETSIIYLSRIGVQEGLTDLGIGKILGAFFHFIIKKRNENFIIFFKVRKDYQDWFGPKYHTIGSGYDAKWGDFIVKFRNSLTRR